MRGDDQLYELARTAQNRAIKKALRKTQARQRPCTVLPEPTLSPTQRQGRRVEKQAARHLEEHGLVIVAYNLRCKAGEIDLVALDQQVLVFIEVRSRHSRRYGGAAASVNRAKQQRLIKTALFFLPRLAQRYFSGTPSCRFDVVSVEPAGLVWTKHAFDTN